MSEVPLLDAKTSLKKMVSLMVDISGLSSDYILKLRSQPEFILSSIDDYEKVKAALISTINNNNGQINTFKNKIMQNQRDISKFIDDNKELEVKRQELLNEIQARHDEFKQTKETIRLKIEELETKTFRLKELENNVLDLIREVEKFELNLKALEKELEQTFVKKEKFVHNFENRVAAMKLLINKKYVTSSLYQFIRALQVGSELDLKNILLAIDMRDDQAKRIINKMLEEGAPIEYDNTNGTIKLNEEVDF